MQPFNLDSDGPYQSIIKGRLCPLSISTSPFFVFAGSYSNNLVVTEYRRMQKPVIRKCLFHFRDDEGQWFYLDNSYNSTWQKIYTRTYLKISISDLCISGMFFASNCFGRTKTKGLPKMTVGKQMSLFKCSHYARLLLLTIVNSTQRRRQPQPKEIQWPWEIFSLREITPVNSGKSYVQS